MDYTQYIPESEKELFTSWVINKPNEVRCCRCGCMLPGKKRGKINNCPECQARTTTEMLEEKRITQKYRKRKNDYKICGECGIKFHSFGNQRFCQECGIKRIEKATDRWNDKLKARRAAEKEKKEREKNI